CWPQLLPRAKAASLAGQQQRSAGMVSLGVIECGKQCGQHGLIGSVQLVRPVQHQGAPALAPRNANLLAHARLHSDHDTCPNSGRGASSSMQMNSNEWPSGSSKYTLAAGIQESTIGSSVGLPSPVRGVSPARRSAVI